MAKIEDIPEEDVETIRGIMYALNLIRLETAHGSININIVNGEVTEIDMEQRIRPKIFAPWRAKQ